MTTNSTDEMTKKAKRALFLLLTGFTLILVGSGFISAGDNFILVGWIIEAIGVAVGFYGYGYIASVLSNKK